MALTQALSAFNTLLFMGDGAATEAFIVVSELKTVQGPSFAADTIDVTTHNTTAPWHSYIVGLLDGGEMSFDINFIPQAVTHSYTSGIVGDFARRIRRNWKLVYPDPSFTPWIMPGLLTSFEPSADPADVLMASTTVKVAGPPTFQ